jgi:hypothetical protein
MLKWTVDTQAILEGLTQDSINSIFDYLPVPQLW